VAGLLTEPRSATEGLPFFLGPLVESRRRRETRAERAGDWGGNIRGASGPGRHARGANVDQLTTGDGSALLVFTQNTVPLMVASQNAAKRSFVCHPGTCDRVKRTSFHPSDTSNTAKPTLFRPCHTYQINNQACVQVSDTCRTAKMVIVWVSCTYGNVAGTLVCFRATYLDGGGTLGGREVVSGPA